MKGSPAFSFYPRDFLGDPKVLALSTVEVGIYILILAAMWQEGGTLPNRSEFLRKVARMDRRRWQARWENVARLFSKLDGGTILFHKRLDEERNSQQAHVLAKTAAGKRGAAARWQGHSDRIATALPSDGSASASASASANTDQHIHPSIHSAGTAVTTSPSMDGCMDVEVGSKDRRAEIQKLTKKVSSRRKAP